MRFLLNQVRSQAVTVSKSAADSGAQATAKAFAQQCSPNCGCVLRFEVQLSPASTFTTSQTVLDASYNAKRVMTTPTSNGLKPLMTKHASLNPQPILTSCTCTTLHSLADQIVQHLPGKTLQTLKNESNVGVVGTRSSVAFRHTVLNENILPVLKSKEKKWNITKQSSSAEVEGKFIDTEKHFHCYDLVEEALLSLIHERQIGARKDSIAEAFSSTMGGHFSMYNTSKKEQIPFNDADEEEEQHTHVSKHSSMQTANGWLRSSPSSYFLFGEDNAAVSTLNYLQSGKDAVVNFIFGRTEDGDRPSGSSRDDLRPTTTYLQLLDMYGNANEEEVEDDSLDDWVNYVDQIRDQGTTTG